MPSPGTLGVPPDHINEIVNRRRPIATHHALRLRWRPASAQRPR